MNEFLLTLFVPGIVIFVSLWAVFRSVLDGLLRSYGLPPIVPQEGPGAVSAGWGRFLLLAVLTAVILLPLVGLYRRFAREPLRERGVV